jgi:hypothetical protein
VDDPTGAGAAEDPELAAGVVTVLLAAGGLPDEVDEEVPQPATNPTAVTAMITLTTEASRPGTNPARRSGSLFLDRLKDGYG